MATASAQINARIEKDLKANGDAGIAAAGLTPTAAVRALWELAAANTSSPSALLDALFPERKKAAACEAETRRKEKVNLAQRGPSIALAFQVQTGMSESMQTAGYSFDELKEQAYFDAYASDMGWAEDGR